MVFSREQVSIAYNLLCMQVQYPDSLPVMLGDLKPIRKAAKYLSRMEINFDLVSAVDELASQIKLEFDFVREARIMDTIAGHLAVHSHLPLVCVCVCVCVNLLFAMVANHKLCELQRDTCKGPPVIDASIMQSSCETSIQSHVMLEHLDSENEGLVEGRQRDFIRGESSHQLSVVRLLLISSVKSCRERMPWLNTACPFLKPSGSGVSQAFAHEVVPLSRTEAFMRVLHLLLIEPCNQKAFVLLRRNVAVNLSGFLKQGIQAQPPHESQPCRLMRHTTILVNSPQQTTVPRSRYL